jgi:serine/threonine protein kinase
LARQVVEGVRELHSRSFVNGILWRARPPIVVDIYDRVQFWTFDKQFVPLHRRGCCYPPEYGHFQHDSLATNEAEFPTITPKADIFLLGMALWYLAMGYPAPKFPRGSPEETQKLARPFEFRGGDGFIALPPLPERIPKYYRDIVDECRSVDPNDRPSAWRLLERFPPRTDSESPQNEVEGLRNVELSLKSMKKAFSRRVWCEYCWNGVQESYFHCDICAEGNFDICLRCYSQGRHCFDAGHLLVQFVQMESGWTVSNRYHSMVRKLDGRANY